MKKVLITATFLLFSSISLAQLNSGSTYQIKNGSITTTENENIPSGTYVKILRQDTWSTHFQILDSSMSPLSEVKRASSQWMEAAVVNIQPNDLKNVLPNISRVSVPDPNVGCCQPGTNHSSNSMVLPTSESTAATAQFKNDNQLTNYFSCYQRNSSLMNDYTQKYRGSIRQSSKTYKEIVDEDVSENDFNSILSCLLFRESSHWDGKPSYSGAVGLGQFTSIGIADMKSIISYNGPSSNSFTNRIAIQRSEFSAKRLSATALRRNIRLIEAERRNHERFTELKNIWLEYPMKNRPTANQLNDPYMQNNNNHEAIIALSTIMIRNCQIQLRDRNIHMSSKNSLLACAGAYNMGTGGFIENAIGSNENPGLESWIENLKNSSSSQKEQTINHLISIHRCSQQSSNLPPCGTDANFCRDLPNANTCSPRANPLCVGTGECS